MTADPAPNDVEGLQEPFMTPALLTPPETHSPEGVPILANVKPLLYISHFLSTWNSRTFEFGAFLFLAAIYPRTLLPASIYALVRSLVAATLAPSVGRFIDRSERLRTVRISIIGQRVAVALSCVVLLLLARQQTPQLSVLVSYSALAALSVLACIEKMCAIMNTISVERDWVVLIARGNESSLRTMNSQMRRIDLFCKLVAPLLIALIDGVSTNVAIMVTGLMTACSVLLEYFAIARVYKNVSDLQEPRDTPPAIDSASTSSIYDLVWKSLDGLRIYCGHRAFLPSFSLALLYLTVLSFGGQMTTFLLALGVNSSLIGILRGLSAVCELSATWISPKVMKYIGPVRSGIWFINWQIVCVAIACAFLWLDLAPATAAAGTVAAVIASRVGLWGFDLSAQVIVQEEVDAETRGLFSSLEFTFQNVFEMLSFASTVVFTKPIQFKWPAMISAIAVATSGILYAAFVRARRGHLVHLSNCMERHSKMPTSVRSGAWQLVSQSDRDEVRDYEAADTA